MSSTNNRAGSFWESSPRLLLQGWSRGWEWGRGWNCWKLVTALGGQSRPGSRVSLRNARAPKRRDKLQETRKGECGRTTRLHSAVQWNIERAGRGTSARGLHALPRRCLVRVIARAKPVRNFLRRETGRISCPTSVRAENLHPQARHVFFFFQF